MDIQRYKSKIPSLLSDDFDSMFQGFFRPLVQSDSSKATHQYPVVDIDEEENNYKLSAELPGFSKEEISLTCLNGQLTINAEHKESNEQQKESGNILKERRYDRYSRSFNFGSNINEEEISATYKDGVLELIIPKKQATIIEAKNIEVR